MGVIGLDLNKWNMSWQPDYSAPLIDMIDGIRHIAFPQ